jgi:hypothetical protein
MSPHRLLKDLGVAEAMAVANLLGTKRITSIIEEMLSIGNIPEMNAEMLRDYYGLGRDALDTPRIVEKHGNRMSAYKVRELLKRTRAQLMYKERAQVLSQALAELTGRKT